MFPLDNLTKVSTAVHSTRYFNSQLFHGQRVTFWHPSCFNSKYLLAPLGAGLIFIPVPASPASTAGGGDSPSYSGFSTVWQSLTTGVPCFSTQAVYYCVCGLNNPSTGLLSRAAFSLTCVTNCLPIHCLLNLFHARVH